MINFKLENLNIISVIKEHNQTINNTQISYNTHLPYHELIYHFSGNGNFVFDDTDFSFNAGKLIYLPKGSHKNYFANLLDSGECVDIFFDTKSTLCDNAFCFNLSENKAIEKTVSKLYNIWTKKETGYYNKTMSLFFEIISNLEIHNNTYLPYSKIEKLNPAIDYIHLHYTEHNFNYSILPTLCGIGYTYFKTLFRMRYGMLPSEYVKNLKIKHSCELLLTNKFTISQIAEKCGFSDIYYFSKVFKQTYGIPPSKWK